MPSLEDFTSIGLRTELITMFVITAVLFVIIIGIVIANSVVIRRYGGHRDVASPVSLVVTMIIEAGVIGATLIALVPFNTAYYQVYQSSGKIEAVVSSAALTSSGATASYVAQAEFTDEPLVFTDPRILLKDGANIKVNCTLEWVPRGADRLNCWIA